MTEFTELEQPPEYRGQKAEAYASELSRWALRYHLTLNPLIRRSKQIIANLSEVAALTQTIDAVPTQGQVLAIQTKVNEIIASAAVT